MALELVVYSDSSSQCRANRLNEHNGRKKQLLPTFPRVVFDTERNRLTTIIVGKLSTARRK